MKVLLFNGSTRKNGNSNQQFVLLAPHRQKMLNSLHKYQKYIDCLDYPKCNKY